MILKYFSYTECNRMFMLKDYDEDNNQRWWLCTSRTVEIVK